MATKLGAFELTIVDEKNPRFYMKIPTSDGRWMVAYALNDVLTVLSEFAPGSSDDADAVVASRNRAEMASYVEKSRQTISARHEDNN